MGNESGDLDSVVSSVTLSYLLGKFGNPIGSQFNTEIGRIVPLVQWKREEQEIMHRENAVALSVAEIGLEDVPHLDDIQLTPDDKVAKWENKVLGLVDHNVKLPRWDRVPTLVVVDHHFPTETTDEKAAMYAVDPKTASTCTVIASIYRQQIEAGLVDRKAVDLLLLGVMMDTHNMRLKRGDLDLEMYELLYRRSTASSEVGLKQLNDEFSELKVEPYKPGSVPSKKHQDIKYNKEIANNMEKIYQKLFQIQDDISDFSTLQLLARDAKSLTYEVQGKTIKIALPYVGVVPPGSNVETNDGVNKLKEYLAEYLEAQKSDIAIGQFHHYLLLTTKEKGEKAPDAMKVLDAIKDRLITKAPVDTEKARRMDIKVTRHPSLLLIEGDGNRRHLMKNIQEVIEAFR
ncbi:hypothetical protein ACQY0O_002312 [Thecaphora frezii]